MSGSLRSEIVRALSVHGLPKSARQELSRFSPAQWRRLLPWLHASGIALYFWERMRSNGEQDVAPRDMQKVLEECLRMNRKRVDVMKREFSSVNQALSKGGIHHAALKGFSLIPEYCPDPALRTQYDLDFLIAPESAELADSCLRRAGFVRKEGSRCSHPVVYLGAHRKIRPPRHAGDLYSPCITNSIEVHTRLWEAENENVSFEFPADPLVRVRNRDWNGMRFASLSTEEALLFQVLHAFRHMLNNRCRLSIFLEIAQFVETHSSATVFWTSFAALLKERVRLGNAAAVVIYLARSLFDCRMAAKLTLLLETSLPPAMDLWLSRYGIRSAMENFASRKDSLYLHELFVDNTRAWRFQRRSKLFPLQMPRTQRDLALVGQSPAHGAHEFRRRVRAHYKDMLYFATRFRFHTSSGARYVWGLPAWKSVVRASSGARGTEPGSGRMAQSKWKHTMRDLWRKR